MSSGHDLLASSDPLIQLVDDEVEPAAELTVEKEAPVSGGPRLGKLKGLGESKSKRKRPVEGAPKPVDKGGIKLLPLIMMIIVFLPAILPVFVYLFDTVATTDWGIKMGLSKSPEEKLKEVYMKYNPAKIPEIPKLLKKNRNRVDELIARVEAKYKLQEKLKKEAEEYGDN